MDLYNSDVPHEREYFQLFFLEFLRCSFYNLDGVNGPVPVDNSVGDAVGGLGPDAPPVERVVQHAYTVHMSTLSTLHLRTRGGHQNCYSVLACDPL
jgi:hypothetical protein